MRGFRFGLASVLWGSFVTYSFPPHKYRKIFEGLIFEGAYLRKEICVSKSIGLAL